MREKPFFSASGLPKHLLIAFGLALALYASLFAFDQHLRTRKGPWQVLFTTNAQGNAMIVVNQGKLQITNLEVEFIGEHATNTGTVAFEEPNQPIPFGQIKFQDLTYLPGSVAFNFFGHELELLPRTLYLNKKEYPWASGKRYSLRPDEKLRPEMSYDPRTRRRKVN